MFIKPFKTIVVGVDFSEYSKIVVEQAQRLAEHWRVKLVLVHASNEPSKFLKSHYFSNRKPPSVDSLKNRIRSFYNLKKRSLKIVVDYSQPTKLIRAVAKSETAPLIMVGYCGHSQLTEFFFGSTARNLALDSNGPVWVHRGYQVVLPARVLGPHDLSRRANCAIDLCENLKLVSPLSYDVFFVRQRPLPVLDYSAYQNIENELVKHAHTGVKNLLFEYPRIEFQSTSGDVTEKIVEKTKDFDLVLLTHRKQKSFLSLSETSYLMGLAQKPLLII